jgi:hypothetical protein
VFLESLKSPKDAENEAEKRMPADYILEKPKSTPLLDDLRAKKAAAESKKAEIKAKIKASKEALSAKPDKKKEKDREKEKEKEKKKEKGKEKEKGKGKGKEKAKENRPATNISTIASTAVSTAPSVSTSVSSIAPGTAAAAVPSPKIQIAKRDMTKASPDVNASVKASPRKKSTQNSVSNSEVATPVLSTQPSSTSVSIEQSTSQSGAQKQPNQKRQKGKDRQRPSTPNLQGHDASQRKPSEVTSGVIFAENDAGEKDLGGQSGRSRNKKNVSASDGNKVVLSTHVSQDNNADSRPSTGGDKGKEAEGGGSSRRQRNRKDRKEKPPTNPATKSTEEPYTPKVVIMKRDGTSSTFNASSGS